jgi:hypothetical protein
MAKKTAIDKMAEAVSGILSEYAEDIQASLDTITKRIGAEGAKTLRRKSREAFPSGSGEYAKGWKYEFRKTRREAKTTIFNEHYSMPHLLEHPHAIRNGVGSYGEAQAHPHIRPVEEELIETYEREVVAKL